MQLNKKALLNLLFSLLVINLIGLHKQVNANDSLQLPVDLIIQPEQIETLSESFNIVIVGQEGTCPLPISSSGEGAHLVLSANQTGYFEWTTLPDLGVYHYLIYQVAGDSPGVIYDSRVYQLTLIVQRDSLTDQIIPSMTLVEKGKTEKKNRLIFTNEFPAPTTTEITTTETSEPTTTSQTPPPPKQANLPFTGERAGTAIQSLAFLLVLAAGLICLKRTK